MKKTVSIIAGMLLAIGCTVAQADVSSEASAGALSQSNNHADFQGNGASKSGSDAGAAAIVNNYGSDKVKYEGGYTIKTAPAVAAPGLTTTLSKVLDLA